jgi:putative protease
MLSATAVAEDGRLVHLDLDAGTQKADNQERMLGMIKTQMGKSAGDYRFALAEVSSADGLPFMSASFLNGIRRTLAEMLDEQPAGCRPLLNRRPEDIIPLPFPGEQCTYKQNVANRLSKQIYRMNGAGTIGPAYELDHTSEAELMRTKYCIRYELGICPVHQKGLGPKGSSQKDANQNLSANLRDIKPDTRLFLLNNGRRLALHFDCKRCEMTVSEA